MSLERAVWLDSLRGITVCLVILNHCIQTTAVMLEKAGTDFHSAVYDVNNILGLVRMPAFFLCSGILFAVASKRGWGWFFKKRLTWTLWIVGFWGLLAILLINAGFHLYPWNSQKGISILQITLVEPTGVLWFVYAIAICGMFCMAIKDTKPMIALFAAALVSVVCIIAVDRMSFPDGIHLVLWNLGVRGLLFFTIGFVFSKQLMTPRQVKAIGFASALLVWAGCAYLMYAGGAKDIHRFLLGVPATLSAVYALQYLLPRLPAVADVFGYLGRRSLELFLLHMFFVAVAYVSVQPLVQHVSSLTVLAIMFLTALALSNLTAEWLRRVPGNVFFSVPPAGFFADAAQGRWRRRQG